MEWIRFAIKVYFTHEYIKMEKITAVLVIPIWIAPNPESLRK